MTMKGWMAGGVLAAALALGGCKGGGNEGTGGSGSIGSEHANYQNQVRSENPAQAQVPGNIEPEHAPSSAKVLQGTISAVDPKQNKVTIYAPDRGSFTLNVDPNTRITLNGNPSSLNQLTNGSSVRAAYEMKGMQRQAVVLDTQAVPQ